MAAVTALPQPSPDPGPPPAPPRQRLLPWSGRAPTLSFSEHQHGFIAPDPDAAVGDDVMTDTETFETGYRLGLDVGSSLDFTVQVAYDDVTAVLADPAAPASMTGTVTAPALSHQALMVTNGSFVLLRRDASQVETSHMLYEMDLRSVEGAEFRLVGYKVIHEGPQRAAWPDSTTLFVTVRPSGAGGGGDVVRRGITRVGVGDFVDLLRTMQVGNVADPARRLRYKVGFGRVLVRSLVSHYGGSLDELGRFPTLPAPRGIPLPRGWGGTCETLLWSVGRGWFACDGGDMGDACSRLIHYGGRTQTKGPVIVAGGFGMPSWSLTALTIEKNLVEYLIEHGYDVWLFDYDSGSDLPSARTSFTLDDIADDWTRAIPEVCRRSGRETVQCLGHCVGSAGLLMAVLQGNLDVPSRVRSMVCAQYTLFPYGSALNRAKNLLGVGQLLELLGVETVSPDTAPTLKDVALDLALRPIPLPAGEQCGESVCRWINAIYGLTHAHAQLNDDTHAEIGDIFGVGNLTALRQIGLTMVRQRLVDARGRDVYLTEENLRHFTMPVHFVAGVRNYIFRPKGARRSVGLLRHVNRDEAAKDYFTVDYLPGYAHLDAMIGRDAARDVFPRILAKLDQYESLP